MFFLGGNADFQNNISVLEHKMYLTFLMHMCVQAIWDLDKVYF